MLTTDDELRVCVRALLRDHLSPPSSPVKGRTFSLLPVFRVFLLFPVSLPAAEPRLQDVLSLNTDLWPHSLGEAFVGVSLC